MEINSVGSAYQQAFSTSKPVQQDYPGTTQDKPKAARQTAGDSVQAAAPEERQRNAQPVRAEAAKIFVNAQGQKTGTIISETA